MYGLQFQQRKDKERGIGTSLIAAQFLTNASHW
jgi:hypothetical protein